MFSKTYGFFCWLKNYLVTFIFLYTIPGLKKRVFKTNFQSLEKDMKRFGKLSLGSFGFEVELINPHNVDLKKNFILAANHRSWFDQISLMASFPKGIHFLAKSEYFEIPILGKSMHNLEMIPVKNKNLDKAGNKVLINSLKRNENVCFFVEGTRGSGRELLPFKKGAFQYAAKFNKPILPIYILGAEQCSSKQRHLFDINPGTITIVVGRPAEFSRENLDQEFSDFESRYRRVHNQLYLEHEAFQKSQQQTLLPETLQLV